MQVYIACFQRATKPPFSLPKNLPGRNSLQLFLNFCAIDY